MTVKVVVRVEAGGLRGQASLLDIVERPAFSVQLKTEGEPSVEKFQAAMKARHAVPRLKEELKRVLGDAGAEAMSVPEILAKVFLAVAQANVNPSWVEVVIVSGDGTETLFRLDTLHKKFHSMRAVLSGVFYDFEMNLRESLYQAVHANNQVARNLLMDLDSLFGVGQRLNTIAQLVSMADDKPNPFTVISLHQIARSIYNEDSRELFEMIESAWRVSGSTESKAYYIDSVFEAAASAVADEDVKQLASIYARMARIFHTISTGVLSHLSALTSVSEELSRHLNDPDGFASMKNRLARDLMEGAMSIRMLELTLDGLMFEAGEVVGRLRERPALLDQTGNQKDTLKASA